MSRYGSTVYMTFGAFTRPVAFENCPELARDFASILRGWKVTRHRAPPDEAPLVRFARTPDGYRWTSQLLETPRHWQEDPPRTSMDALCDFHYEFIDWYLWEFPDHLCLHCAAVAIGGKLAVFPSRQKAGKSILTAQLAARGCQVFGDDVLAIRPGDHHGVALGVLPRLRLPLPGKANMRLRRFVDARRGPSDERYLYLDLADGEMAPLGAALPIGALVTLERKKGGPVGFTAVTRGELLRQIISQNFAENISPTLIFERLLAVAEQARCLTLNYADAAEAADLLVDRLGDVREGRDP